jgi:hypothetical protein
MDTGGHSPEMSRDEVGRIAYVVAIALDVISLAIDNPRRAWWPTSTGSTDIAPDTLTGYADRLYEIARRPSGPRDVPYIRSAVRAAKEAAISLQPYRAMPSAQNYPAFGDLADLVSQVIALLTSVERALESYA